MFPTLYNYLHPRHLSLVRIAIIDYIYLHPGCTISDLSSSLHISRTPIHNHLTHLRRLKYIYTRTHIIPSDNRLVRIFTTSRADGNLSETYSIIHSALHPKSKNRKS